MKPVTSNVIKKTLVRGCVVLTTALLLSACSFMKKEEPEVVVVPPPPPPAEPELKPALLISQMYPEQPTGRGDAGAFIDFVNATDGILEYVMFKTTAYDSQGRVVHSKKSGDPNTWLRIAGPFTPGQSSGSRHWEQLWQNLDLACFEIEGAEVIYINGLVEFYHADQIAVLPSSETQNNCI